MIKYEFKHCLGIKMYKITDFQFKIVNICSQLNRIRRPYKVIGHLEVYWIFFMLLMTKISF